MKKYIHLLLAAVGFLMVSATTPILGITGNFEEWWAIPLIGICAIAGGIMAPHFALEYIKGGVDEGIEQALNDHTMDMISKMEAGHDASTLRMLKMSRPQVVEYIRSEIGAGRFPKESPKEPQHFQDGTTTTYRKFKDKMLIAARYSDGKGTTDMFIA